MKNFDKKLLITLIFLFIIISIAIYFFTKEENDEITLSNELYVLPDITTNEEKLETIIIHIAGEIATPGIVSLPIGSRISNAIEAAGGTTPNANISKVNLAYELKDGQKVYIPSIYDNEDTSYIQSDAGNNVIAPDISTTTSLININLANSSELESLPGIGSSTAAKIIDYRNKNGKFKKIEDIMNVSGIGEAKFNSIKDHICI